jgi:CheY-like chemotaxis protein
MSDNRQDDEQEFPLEPPRQEWPHAKGKECVVVAEDSEALRDLVLAMLSGLGYEVLTAAGGHEALRQIERHHGVDLVITDAIMPRGGGFQIIDEMRSRWPGTPIVITSGFTEEIEAGLRERTGSLPTGVESKSDERADDEEADAPAAETGDAAITASAPVPIIEFLPKPFKPEQLARLVRDVLDRSRSDAPRKRG